MSTEGFRLSPLRDAAPGASFSASIHQAKGVMAGVTPLSPEYAVKRTICTNPPVQEKQRLGVNFVNFTPALAARLERQP